MIKEDSIIKNLGLTSSISTANMNMFNENGIITKYNNISEIFEDFYNFRLNMYDIRKKHILSALKNHVDILKYKVKFIQEVIDETISLGNKKKTELVTELSEKGYPLLSTNLKVTTNNNDDNDEEDNADENNAVVNPLVENNNGTYNYLLDMKLWTLTYEKLEELKKQMHNEEAEYERYKNLTLQKLWESEIDEFIVCYKKWLSDLQNDSSLDKNIKIKGKKGKAKTTKPKKAVSSK